MKTEHLDPIRDEILMDRVSQGDLDSLVPLFERYERRLYNFFLRLSYDQIGSDDLVQNLFLRIIRYRQSYDPSRSFRTWVYQMARNLYYDHYKAEKKTRDGFMDVDRIEDEQAPADTFDDTEDREGRLLEAMKKLPEDKRELLVLSKLQGLPYEQIAIITDTTVNNVKVRVHRALENLRTIYFKQEQV